MDTIPLRMLQKLCIAFVTFFPDNKKIVFQGLEIKRVLSHVSRHEMQHECKWKYETAERADLQP